MRNDLVETWLRSLTYTETESHYRISRLYTLTASGTKIRQQMWLCPNKQVVISVERLTWSHGLGWL